MYRYPNLPHILTCSIGEENRRLQPPLDATHTGDTARPTSTTDSIPEYHSALPQPVLLVARVRSDAAIPMAAPPMALVDSARRVARLGLLLEGSDSRSELPKPWAPHNRSSRRCCSAASSAGSLAAGAAACAPCFGLAMKLSDEMAIADPKRSRAAEP